jgi:exosortase F-associated protein
MLKKLFRNKAKVLLIISVVLLLASVRAFEDTLFYDPFSAYFKNDYLNLAFPEYQSMALFFSMTFRYLLNAFFSLIIIQALFKDWQLTGFATTLYVVFFVILITAFFLLIAYSDNHNTFILFYVRRFLIQPIFLLLFVPAFYYQQLQAKK